MNIKKDTRSLSPEVLMQRKHAHLLGLNELLPILASPDQGLPLHVSECRTALTDGINTYELRADLPILIPTRLAPYFTNRLQVPFVQHADTLLQYFLLATIKQSGEINASPAEEAAQKHFFRMSEFLLGCKGITLDVGCDDPQLGASLFTEDAQYIGLDPFCSRLNPFRVIGVGEYLPFKNESLDNVVFNTSLDHILDWRHALHQAKLALKTQGSLYISTYIWTDKASLLADSVHFHHFRYYDILGALEELGFCEYGSEVYESPKGDSHRHGLYIKAYKK
jgi:SAM-dependent methyltransferase